MSSKSVNWHCELFARNAFCRKAFASFLAKHCLAMFTEHCSLSIYDVLAASTVRRFESNHLTKFHSEHSCRSHEIRREVNSVAFAVNIQAFPLAASANRTDFVCTSDRFLNRLSKTILHNLIEKVSSAFKIDREQLLTSKLEQFN